jgi:siroheme synthase-like protein
MKTYPINLVLEDKLVILIGAGKEIGRKIPGLLEVGARVRVIAPAAQTIVRRYAAEEKIEWLDRRYQPGDLIGAALVIAATGDPQVHNQIWAEGQANGQLVNVMDVISSMQLPCRFGGASGAIDHLHRHGRGRAGPGRYPPQTF